MHIPDGFISPQTYIPAIAISASLLALAYKKIELDVEKIPLIAGVSAISFVMMLIAIPFPGGTTMHLSGVAIIALLFGPWIAFSSISLVLLIQALLFGEGGITSYPINIIAMAFVGSFSAYYSHKLLSSFSKNSAMFMAGWASIFFPSIIIALVLGIQPLIASSDGTPLYFPFGLSVTLPSVIIPHIFIGIVEGLVTLSSIKFLRTQFRSVFDE
nr:energy-coupling factor ABC transporter permease [uncultured Sulfurimonas sp.]